MTRRCPEESPGWYGKLSVLGDFAQRRLPVHCVQRCDAWLSALMGELPAVLGRRWLDAYLAAPILRFAWAPGVIDMRWWFGVLMPSCDNVGRYFPLLVAQSRAQPPVDCAGLERLDRWYAVLTLAALHTLEERASLERFEQLLAMAPAWPASSVAPLPVEHDAGGWQALTLPGRQPMSAWVPMLAAGELLERLAGSTVWWPGREAFGESVRWGPGLPPATEFARFLLQSGPSASTRPDRPPTVRSR